MNFYQGAEISKKEIDVLRSIEDIIGEPVPYKGLMPYFDGWDSCDPDAIDPRAYGSNPNEHYIDFGFRTSYKHVTELGLNNKGIKFLPGFFGQLKWLKILNLENNQLTDIPQSIVEIFKLNRVNLKHNLLSSLPIGFKVHVGDPFGAFKNCDTNLDLQQNPLKRSSLLIILKHTDEGLDILVPNELLHLSSSQILDYNSLQLITQKCSQCVSSQLITGKINVTQQTLTFCPKCEQEIAVTPLKAEIKARLDTQIGKLEVEFGVVFPKLSQISEFKLGYTGKSNHIIGLGVYNVKVPENLDTIEEIDTLRSLTISQTPMKILPKSICKLINLQQLSLLGNKLNSLPSLFSNLKQLQELKISSNHLVTLPDSFGNLPNLRKLTISNNPITSLPFSFGNLANLKILNLIDNQIITLPDSIGNLKNLEELNMQGNQIVSLPESIGNLSKLKTLNIKNNKIKILPKSVGNLKNLGDLDLRGCQLTSLPDSFWNLENLVNLNLMGNKIKSLPNLISNLSNLLSLNLTDTPLSESLDERERLIKLLPKIFEIKYITYAWE